MVKSLHQLRNDSELHLDERYVFSLLYLVWKIFLDNFF